MLWSLRTVVLSAMGSLVFIGLALSFVLGPSETAFDAPPPWLPVGQVAAALLLHLILETVGYYTPIIEPGTDQHEAGRTSSGALSAGTVLRAALSESLAIASLAAALLVASGEMVTYLVGAALALVLLAVHAFPGERPLRKTQAGLERAGGSSYLRERLGLSDLSGGAVPER